MIGFTFYCYYPFNPSVSFSLYPLAFVGCWWDLRRDSSLYYLRNILVLGVFQGLCGVWIINNMGEDEDGMSEAGIGPGGVNPAGLLAQSL
jgi:hypothetical protein